MADRARTRYFTVRPRRVPPEFCSDERLEECSLLAAHLLVRVITQADDQGRLPGAPRSVRGLCFPLRPEITERKVAAALDELVTAGFLVLYVLEGRAYLQVSRWQDLQGKWGRRAYPSRYPAPPGWTDDWVNTDDGEPEDPKLRAPGAQDTRDVHTPIPFPSSSSPPLPFTASHASPGSTPGVQVRAKEPGRPEQVGHILGGGLHKKERVGAMTDEEAFELGSSLAKELTAEVRIGGGGPNPTQAPGISAPPPRQGIAR